MVLQKYLCISLLITSVDFIVLIDENDALYRFIKVVFQLFFRWLLLVWIGLNWKV